MKLRYKGGHKIKVFNPDSGEHEDKPVEALEQLFEEALYVWPKPGAVLSLDDGVAGWMLAKHPKLLEALPDDRRDAPKAAPRVFVAVVPEDTKKKGNPKEAGDEPEK